MASAQTVAKVGTTEYESLAAAVTAANAGETVSIVTAGTYTLPGISKNITVQGDVAGVVFNHTTAGNIASIPNGATFKNVTFNFGNVNYHGFQGPVGAVNMDNCTLNGKFFSYGDMNFTNCQFVQDNEDYHMWVYGKGTVTYTNCTFTNNKIGKFLNLYTESSTNVGNVVVKNCKFINNGKESKAAINVKATCGSTALVYTLSVDNECTVEGAFPTAGVKDNSEHTDVISALVQVDDRTVAASAENITVEVDNVPVYQSGAETEVVEINTVDDLKAFRDAVNSVTSYAGKIVRLMADLDLSSEDNWTPIGNLAAYPGQSFKGTFDGNGHIISNLTVNDNTPEYAVAALFGSIEEGSIVNLTVKDVNITSTHFAAGIVAYTSNTPSIINCHVVGGTITSTPELVGSSYDNGDKAGGIMGYCTAGTTIKDCTVEGVTITAYRDLAGICGYADGSVADCTVKDVTVVQDNTNGYKTEDVAYTACEVVGGRSANAAATNAANTTENVTVNTGVTANYVAQIGTTKYETLEAAIDAAQNGEAVTLLADCAGNGIKVPQGKFATGLTVDFGGFTYTIDGDLVGSTGTQTLAFQLLKDNKITFQNGTIYSEKAKMLVQNYSDLTLNNMTLTLNNTSYNGAYTLSNNNGEVVIDGSTINANPTTGSFAFDVCRYASYPSVNVEVKGSSVINGNVEISASGSDAKDGFSLTLEDGTMSGNIVVAASAAAAMESTPEKAVVTKADAFDKTAPEGFKWESNGDGTSTLVEDIIVLTDGIAYTNAADIANAKVAYKRTYTDAHADKFQPWMVPFKYTITSTDVENFDFFEINQVEYAQGSTTKMQIRISSAMAAGAELEANKPYIYMPKSAVGEYTFKAKDVTLTAADGTTARKSFDVAEGVEVNFYSVYQNTKPTDANYIYYMSKNSKVGYSNNANTSFAGVGPFRWIFKVSGTNAPSTAFTFGFAADEDDDVTAVSSAAVEAEGEVVGYYTLNGQKVSEPTKGVYVVKYANGTSKKVVF